MKILITSLLIAGILNYSSADCFNHGLTSPGLMPDQLLKIISALESPDVNDFTGSFIMEVTELKDGKPAKKRPYENKICNRR